VSSPAALEHLWAPWRSRYVRDAKRLQQEGCLFCGLGRLDDAREALRLYASPGALVVLNLFPYSTGHLMVAPRRHLASPTEADVEEWHEVADLVVYSERVLRRAYRPDGMNVGMNLGEAAGAGVPTHCHVHLVPRWSGDTNFMTSLAGTRVHPESLEDTYDRLLPFFSGGLRAPSDPLFASDPPMDSDTKGATPS